MDFLHKMAEKRNNNDIVASWMRKHLTDESQACFEHCGDYLVVLEDETRTNKKLDTGFFCKQRLCSGCSWRSSVRSAQCVASISEALTREQGRVMVFLTLTVPNVEADKLRETISHLNESWKRLLKRKGYEVFTDNIRKLEITYNAQRDDYHPHLHIIAYVPREYFAGRNYISQAKLLDDWRSATRQPNITQVNIKRCRDLGTTNAILEVSKYSAKASDYRQSEKVFDAMYDALYHTRLMTYAGAAKKLRKDYEAGKLEHYEELDTTKYVYRVVYLWERLANAYSVHDVEEYHMDAEELARLQRDENRLAEAAMSRAAAFDPLRQTWEDGLSMQDIEAERQWARAQKRVKWQDMTD